VTSWRVAVIGGAGRLGRYIVDELRPHYDVIVLDRTVFGSRTPAKVVDITALDDLRKALEDIDAVVHVAGIDGHVQAAPETFFETNVVGTWNVLQAASEAGIRKVIVTSSTSATGLNVADPLTIPEYLPIDEGHPLVPADAYGLGKQINEITGASFGRRPDMHVVCIRPTYIAFPDLIPHLMGAASTFGGEVPAAFQEPRPLLRTYVDPSDLARCYRLALAFESTGFDLFWASAADTFEPMPTLEYFKSIYGVLPDIRRPDIYQRDAHASIIDCSLAKRVLNWVPEISWSQLSQLAGGGIAK
jgi:UDP-glucose 4-epimerase